MSLVYGNADRAKLLVALSREYICKAQVLLAEIGKRNSAVVLVIVVVFFLACGNNVKGGGGGYAFVLVGDPEVSVTAPITAPAVFYKPSAV